MASQYDVLMKAADAVSARLGRAPVGVVLGTGLSESLDHLERPQYMDFAEIPGMPEVTSQGHRGSLLHGYCGDTPVLGLCGRLHTYEGRPMDEVAASVRLLSLLGVGHLVVTSAVSSLDPELEPGTVMLTTDHINWSGVNVLAGAYDRRFGPRTPDMHAAYDPGLFEPVEEAGRLADVPVSRGIVLQILGPATETAAEVEVARRVGARAMTMSMVPEVMVARQRSMRVLGLACVTNMASGLPGRRRPSDNAWQAAALHTENLQALCSGILPHMVKQRPQGC